MASAVQQAARGTLWSSAATYGGKALVLVSTIILARLLDEATFGIVTIALMVIAFLEVLQDLGIGSAVIYEHDEEAAQTGFWLGLGVGLGLFGLTWLAAPCALMPRRHAGCAWRARRPVRLPRPGFPPVPCRCRRVPARCRDPLTCG